MKADVVGRFWAKVDKRGPDECWPWTGSIGTDGYGRLQVRSKASHPLRASRVSYEITHGTDPGPSFVLHSCDNPGCVNPAHLRLGDRSENMLDMYSRGRRGMGVEAVRLIRSSSEPASVLAVKIGVDSSAIRKVRSGKTHRRTS